MNCICTGVTRLEADSKDVSLAPARLAEFDKRHFLSLTICNIATSIPSKLKSFQDRAVHELLHLFTTTEDKRATFHSSKTGLACSTSRKWTVITQRRQTDLRPGEGRRGRGID